MKKAFTLIELIFVIVIIGILAAVAVPKFTNLKQSAEASNVIKTTVDAASAAVNVAVNLRDLEGNTSYQLRDLVKLEGKGWEYIEPVSGTHDGSYELKNNEGNDTIASITLDKNSNRVEYTIKCSAFDDPKTKDKCEQLLGNKASIDVNLSY